MQFHPFCLKFGEKFPSLTKLTLRRAEEFLTWIDHFTPDPHLFSTTLSDMATIWNDIVTEKSSITKLVLQFQMLNPWDRDVHFNLHGQPNWYAGNKMRRTYIAQAGFPVKQNIETVCLDLEEARRAVEHQWQWVKFGSYPRHRNWADRVEEMHRLVSEARNLVIRRTPNADGQFVSFVLIGHHGS